MSLSIKVTASVVSTLLSIFCLTNLAYAEPTAQDIQRNQITSGDNSLNVIVGENSNVLIFRRKDGSTERKIKEEILRELKDSRPSAFEDAARTLPNQSESLIDDLALANYTFEIGQYSLSAALYEDIVSRFEKEDIGYNALEGLTTASYFGSGRHVQGLQFICKQYKSRPKWSYRFRHEVHAHLRALTHKFGHNYAQNVLIKIRENEACRREDFSEAWIPIHLSDMRAIEISREPSSYNYSFNSEKDKQFARELIEEGNHGFIDYVYFVNGDYETILEKFPKSYIYDLSLLGMGLNENTEKAIWALELFIKKFKDSINYRYAVKLLFKRALEKKNIKLINSLILKYQNDLDNTLFSDVNYSYEEKVFTFKEIALFNKFKRECISHRNHVKSLNFRSLALSFRSIHNDLLTLYGNKYDQEIPQKFLDGWRSTCGFYTINSHDIVRVIAFFENADHVFSKQITPDKSIDALEKIARTLKSCGDMREFGQTYKSDDKIANICDILITYLGSRVSFHSLSTKLLEHIYDIEGDQAHHLLFLAALAHKHNNEYGKFLAKLQRYVFEQSDKSFADDAITEIGWYYLVVKQNPSEADKYFELVIRYYEESNAFDNALNWLVISKKNQGDYSSAFFYALELSKHVSSNRIMGKILGRHETLRQISTSFDTGKARITVGTGWDRWSVWGVDASNAIVVKVAPELANTIPPGSQIFQVNGLQVSSSDEFYLALHRLEASQTQYVALSYSPPHTWKSEYLVFRLSDFGWFN